jgi:hypothetical protein
LLTVAPAAVVLAGQSLGGPAADSFFGRLGALASHGVPLALVAVGLVGHALRDRSPGYAFAAGAVVNLIVAGGYALGVAVRGEPFDAAVWVHLGQRFSITASLWAIAWLVVADWLRRRDGTEDFESPLLVVQRWLGSAGNVVLLGAAA